MGGGSSSKFVRHTFAVSRVVFIDHMDCCESCGVVNFRWISVRVGLGCLGPGLSCVVSSQCCCAPPKHFRGGRFQNCVVECWGHWGGLGLDAFLVLPPGPLRLWWHLHLPNGHQMSLEIAWNLSPGLGPGCWARGQFPEGLKNAMFCWSKTGEPFEKVFPSRGSGRNFAFFNPSSVFHSSQMWLGCASQWFGCSPVASEIPPVCRTSGGLPKFFRSSMDWQAL